MQYNKLVACADLHIKREAPRYRKDDYVTTALNKLRWITEFTEKNNARLVIGGDLFDSSKVPHWIVNKVMQILSDLRFPPFAVAGQHDMRFHSQDLEESPLHTLALAELIQVLGPEGNGEGYYGAGYGQDIPDIVNCEDAILLTHRSLTEKEPPFFLPDAQQAVEFLKQYPMFRYVISGDYHVPFHVAYRRRHVINCGPMLRASKDQMHLKPVVWLIDLEKGTVEPHEIPIAPASEVFDLEAIEYEEKRGIQLDMSGIVAKLKMDPSEALPNFSDIVRHVCEMLVADGVIVDKKIVDTVLKEHYA